MLLVGALTHPLLAPGALALRDMLVLPSPALSPAAFGVGDLPARNVPQDALLAIAGVVIDASWLARALIIAGAAAGAAGAWWLTRVVRPGASAWAIAAAMTVAVWNPFVVERLLQGHWSLVIAAWLLPGVAAAARSGRTLAAAGLVFAASLTPTGVIMATLVAVFSARSWAARTALIAVGLGAGVPWIVPGLLHSEAGTTLAQSAAIYAPRAEEDVGTLGALLGLGGIWNGEAVPASREAGFALFGVILFGVLLTAWRRCPTPLLVLAGVGLGSAAISWLFPQLTGLVVAHVPGGGLIRDGQKLVMLALPAYVALAGSLERWVAVLALVLSLAQVPDAPRALQALRPVPLTELAIDEEIVARADGRDVFFPDRPALTRRADGAVILDPYAKAVSKVESGQLVVDGLVTDRESPRHAAAERAWAAGDLTTLERLGIGMVVATSADGVAVVETNAPPRDITGGAVLFAWWVLLGAGLGVLSWPGRRRRGKRRPGHPGRDVSGRSQAPGRNAGGGGRRRRR